MSKINLSPIINYITEETSKGSSKEAIYTNLINNGWSEQDIKKAKGRLNIINFIMSLYVIWYSIFMVIILFIPSLWIDVSDNFINTIIVFSLFMGPILYRIIHKRKPSLLLAILLAILMVMLFAPLIMYDLSGFINSYGIFIVLFPLSFLVSTILMKIGNIKNNTEQIKINDSEKEQNETFRVLIDIYILLLNSWIFLVAVALPFSGFAGIALIPIFMVGLLMILIPIKTFIDLFIHHSLSKRTRIIFLMISSIVIGLPLIFFFGIGIVILIISFFIIRKYNKNFSILFLFMIPILISILISIEFPVYGIPLIILFLIIFWGRYNNKKLNPSNP